MFTAKELVNFLIKPVVIYSNPIKTEDQKKFAFLSHNHGCAVYLI